MKAIYLCYLMTTTGGQFLLGEIDGMIDCLRNHDLDPDSLDVRQWIIVFPDEMCVDVEEIEEGASVEEAIHSHWWEMPLVCASIWHEDGETISLAPISIFNCPLGINSTISTDAEEVGLYYV